MKKTSLLLLQAIITCTCFSQNVGIGTTTPFARLHVTSNQSGVAHFDGPDNMFIIFAENSVNRGYIGSSNFISPLDIDLGTMATNPTGKVHLTTNGISRLTVSSNGNVGIGTINPEHMFSVAAGMSIDQANLNTGTVLNTLRFGNASGEAIGSKRTSGTNQYGLDFYTQGFHRMTIANNGNVGINVLSPSAKLEIRGALGFSSTTKRWEMSYDSTDGYFYIDEFGFGRRLYIANGGNVGIGTSTPAAKLDVNGDINIESKILLNNTTGTSGQVLVSGGSGSPSWRNTSFGTNDRFMFKTNLLTMTSGFSTATPFTNVYSNSSAITYSNGSFTVNKSGFYGIEGVFKADVSVPESITFSSFINLSLDIFTPSSNSLILYNALMDPIVVSGGQKYSFKVINYSTKVYLAAGSSFNLHCNFGSDTATQFIINPGYPMSIYLISE